MKECHGCKGLGWVDSKHYGPTLCPICRGTGQVEEEGLLPKAVDTRQPSGLLGRINVIRNKNRLLTDLERWLLSHEGVVFDHSNKRMNTYHSLNEVSGKMKGLVWIYTDGANRMHLRKGDYSTVDIDQRVLYQTSKGTDLWGGYPQFIVQSARDVDYAKKLITYALKNL